MKSRIFQWSGKPIKILSPFLDAWDESASLEAAESELVKLFDVSGIQSSTSSGDGGGDTPKKKATN